MFNVLAQAEVVVEGAGGVGLDPQLAVYSVIIAYLLQALRNIAWVDERRGLLPFVALGLGVALAALRLNGAMGWSDIILSGCLLGLTASGFQSAASKLPLGMNALKNVSGAAAAILLCLCLVNAGGCGKLADNPPTGDQVLRATVDTYAATVETLTEFYEAGKIDDQMATRIESSRALAWMALEEWKMRLEDGKPVSESIRRFTTHFAALIEAENNLKEDR